MNYLYQRYLLRSNLVELNHCIESKKLTIEKTLIDYSDLEKPIEDREGLQDILHEELTAGDTLIIFDLIEISSNISELVKVFDCLLNRDIEIFLCKYDEILNKRTDTLKTIRLLCEIKEQNSENRSSKAGRPKGRFSKSKFDDIQDEIIKLLKEDLSISEMARRLDVSRTSLKDYINSRNLKEIINNEIKKEYEDIPQSECKEKI